MDYVIKRLCRRTRITAVQNEKNQRRVRENASCRQYRASHSSHSHRWTRSGRSCRRHLTAGNRDLGNRLTLALPTLYIRYIIFFENVFPVDFLCIRDPVKIDRRSNSVSVSIIKRNTRAVDRATVSRGNRPTLQFCF